MPVFRAGRRGRFGYRMMATMTTVHPQCFPQVLWMDLRSLGRARKGARHWPLAANGLQ